jgi:uncharacterized protein
MMHAAWGFVCGLIFGAGLVVSGMTDPSKVLNFLDLAGQWDPSLAFVMGGAVAVSFAGYRLAWRRAEPVLEEDFDLPKTTGIDPRLVIGAALFGTGWGIGGFCPGPALTSLPLAASGTLVFVPAMLLGMLGGFHARNAKLPGGRWRTPAT